MTIQLDVLGGPGGDNAAFVRVNAGKAMYRLLLDCGDGCLAGLPVSDILALDHVLFSHLHMDHVAGFDALFRLTFNRPRPMEVWGPPGTIAIIHHRLRGFLWNLYAGEPGVWRLRDIYPDRVEGASFAEAEAFAVAHPEPARAREGDLAIAHAAFSVRALAMHHETTSLAYVIREAPRVNIDEARLAALGLPPGPWLRRVRKPTPDEEPAIEIDGVRHDLAALRADLLVERPGACVAYLTDFLLDDAAMERLVPALRGCDTLVCECQYADADAALAARNYHMTAIQVANLARRAGVGRLILFHLSARYRPPEWREMLASARAIFPHASFPAGWDAELAAGS